MHYKTILLTTQNHKATLTLNRPNERHALNPQMMDEMRHALNALKNTHIRFLVLKSTGPTFCAGADLYWMKSSVHLTLEENTQDAKRLGSLLHALKLFPKPIVAVLEGDVFGGGLGILAACDIILARPHMRMCLSELKLGLIPAMISPYVSAALGMQAFKAYTLTGEIFTSEDAYRLGFVHRIVEPDDMEKALENLEAHLLKNAPRAMEETKKLSAYIAGSPLNEELLHATARWIAEVRESQEGQEGLRAFIEKKQPSWAIES